MNHALSNFISAKLLRGLLIVLPLISLGAVTADAAPISCAVTANETLPTSYALIELANHFADLRQRLKMTVKNGDDPFALALTSGEARAMLQPMINVTEKIGADLSSLSNAKKNHLIEQANGLQSQASLLVQQPARLEDILKVSFETARLAENALIARKVNGAKRGLNKSETTPSGQACARDFAR